MKNNDLVWITRADQGRPQVDVLTLRNTDSAHFAYGRCPASGISVCWKCHLSIVGRYRLQMEYDKPSSGRLFCGRFHAGVRFSICLMTRRIIESSCPEKQLPGARVAYAHGKMRERRLEEIMAALSDNNLTFWFVQLLSNPALICQCHLPLL